MMWRLVFSCLALYYMVMTAMPAMMTSKTPIFQQNVLFVTAHPDDEVMFFGPSLRHALAENRNNAVQLLCLSSGNATGIGALRVRELAQAAHILTLPPQNVTVIDSEFLPDSMEVEWDHTVVADVVGKVMDLHNTSIVVSFDDYGVSGHKNHIAIHHGVKLAVESRQSDPERWALFLSLQSVPLVRKYIFVVDAMISRIWDTLTGRMTIFGDQKDYHLVRKAMTAAHRSQMTWFRWLYVHFSRYMLVNDLEVVTFDTPEVVHSEL